MLVVEPVEHVYEILFFLFPFDYIPVASSILTVVMNLIIFELAISISINSYAYNIFGTMFRNASSPAPIGH